MKKIRIKDFIGVRRLQTRIVNGLLDNSLDPKKANALTLISNSLMQCLQMEELEERISSLEYTLKDAELMD